MIIDSTHNVSTNLKGSVEFSVTDDSAKIFSFLSSFLYKDKERSVLTELCSNALDAHKMVGKADLPIHVQLPTSLQQEVRVRDFGPGLSDSQVIQFLTKYGSSSKNKTADLIGGYGIGSKSPAAVTDTWTIVSRHAGIASTYLIYINEHGIPNINRVFEQETDESGLEVIIPVKTVNEWCAAAYVTFQHYAVLPKITGGNGSYKVSKVKEIFDYKNKFKIFESCQRGYSYDSSAFVLMNHRAYALDFEKIKAASPSKYFKTSVHLPFDTSSLSVSLSREDLQYDSRTISAITARYTVIFEEMQKDWEATVSKSTGLIDYQKNAHAFIESNHIQAELAKEIAIAAKDKYANSVDFFALDRYTIQLDTWPDYVAIINADKTKHVKINSCGEGKNFVKYVSKAASKKIKANYELSFTSKDPKLADVVFVLNDTKNSSARVRYEADLGTSNYVNGILVSADVWDRVPAEFNKIKASSLKNPPAKTRGTSTVNSEIYRVVGRHFERYNGYDAKLPTVALRFSNATTVDSFQPADKKFYDKFQHGVQIICIKEKSAMPKWAMEAKDWAEKEYAALLALESKIILAKKLKVNETLHPRVSVYGVRGLISNMFAKQATLKLTGTALALVKEYNELESKRATADLTAIAKFDNIYSLASFLGKQSPVTNSTIDSEYYIDRMLKAYPMLNFVTGYVDDSTTLKRVYDYINVVDNAI